MKKEMRELYIEGVANHDGPEPCVDAREGSGGALGGVRAGRAIEPRNQGVWGADTVDLRGRQHRRWRYARVTGGPRAVEEPGQGAGQGEHGRQNGPRTQSRSRRAKCAGSCAPSCTTG